MPREKRKVLKLEKKAEMPSGRMVERTKEDIHSIFILFRLFLKCLFKSTTTQKRSRHHMDTVSEFHAKVSHTTASEGLAQGR